MTENPLWDLIQSYMDDPKHRYPPRPADLARETGLSEQLLSKWKSKPMLPEAGYLQMFAYGTGVSYEALLTAALEGRKYLPPGSRVVITDGYDEMLQNNPAIVRILERSRTVHLLGYGKDMSGDTDVSENAKALRAVAQDSTGQSAANADAADEIAKRASKKQRDAIAEMKRKAKKDDN